MKTTGRLICLAWMVLGGVVCGVSANANDGGLKTLRGADVQAADTESTDPFKAAKESRALERDYVQQPPLIPHKVEGYTVTRNFNKCLDCHSWSRYKETGATKVSLTHFKTREGQELSNIAPQRYFCLQCHVSQSDAEPLVSNNFKPSQGIR